MKNQDLKSVSQLPVQELKVQLHETEDKLFKMSFAHAVSPLKNGLELRTLKRHRARLITWIHQKEVVPGSKPA